VATHYMTQFSGLVRASYEWIIDPHPTSLVAILQLWLPWWADHTIPHYRLHTKVAMVIGPPKWGRLSWLHGLP